MIRMLFFSSIVVLIYGCESNSSLYTKKYCNLERLEWQDVTDTVSVVKNNRTQGGLDLKINKDSTAKYGADVDYAGDYKSFVNKTTHKKVHVSQEFYEMYARKRSALCALSEGLRDGTVNSQKGKEDAENLYLEIVRLFAGIENQQVQPVTEKKN